MSKKKISFKLTLILLHKNRILKKSQRKALMNIVLNTYLISNESIISVVDLNLAKLKKKSV